MKKIYKCDYCLHEFDDEDECVMHERFKCNDNPEKINEKKVNKITLELLDDDNEVMVEFTCYNNNLRYNITLDELYIQYEYFIQEWKKWKKENDRDSVVRRLISKNLKRVDE